MDIFRQSFVIPGRIGYELYNTNLVSVAHQNGPTNLGWLAQNFEMYVLALR